jgi:hypothetical protein
MSTQIFKYPVPPNILFDFLELICVKNEKFYIFDKSAFKRASFKNILPSFFESLLGYYYLSKHKYLINPPKYNNLCTIIRQICKLNTISYVSNIKYSNSSYEIVYYIYFV